MSEPVRVSLNVEGRNARDTVEVDRVEWDGLTAAQRREMLDDMAEAFASSYVSYGWHIEDEGDMASAES